jgi:hypothetical protein
VATDDCGNSTTHVQVLTVVDTTAPVLDGPAPANMNVACEDDVPEAAVLTATDNCSGSVPAVFAEETNDGSGCGDDPLVITRTWTFTDECDNTSTVTQVITVRDDTPPVIEGALEWCITRQQNTYMCFSREDFETLPIPFSGVGTPVSVFDNCEETPDWWFAGCWSNQDGCDFDGNNTGEDCKIIDDGQTVCVRPEVSGRDDRIYYVAVAATDGCGNEAIEEVAEILVPRRTPNRPQPDEAICVDPPQGCISSLTVRVTEDCLGSEATDCCIVNENTGECEIDPETGLPIPNPDCTETFINSTFTGMETVVCITVDGVEYCDQFHVSCSQCLLPGDLGQWGCLEIVELDHDGRMDDTCRLEGRDSCIREMTLRVMPTTEGGGACAPECEPDLDGNVDPACEQVFSPLEPGWSPDGVFCIDVGGTPYCTDAAGFDVSCRACLRVGDTSGCLVVAGLRERGAVLKNICCDHRGDAEEDCTNWVDDDDNGLVDCDDPACALTNACVEQSCQNGVDDDRDAAVDCDDADCSEDPACAEPEVCDDGVDNDGDGCLDSADDDCGGVETSCSDGDDDDCDGAADCADSDCVGDPACVVEEGRCGDGVCDGQPFGEDCETCPLDCPSQPKGKKTDRFCCGNGVLEPPEAADPELCDGNY